MRNEFRLSDARGSIAFFDARASSFAASVAFTPASFAIILSNFDRVTFLERGARLCRSCVNCPDVQAFHVVVAE
jgi:hypothetical protein